MSEVFSKLGKIQADFNTFRLRDVLTLSDSGFWGDEPEPNTDGTKVIRSTNFTNTGELDLSDVAVRKIAKDKALEKKLLNGDILIERSGGSDTQPVGRVAFSDFEIEKSDYAFANFIQRIRFNNEVEPRFVFYCLLQMHQMGATESIQNQTTGIRNLDLKSYLRVELPKPEKNEQVRISSLLSQVDNVIQKTKDSIAQAQQLKKALMQHLLSGRLKPDGTWRKPDEFYVDDKFGHIPLEWGIYKFDELAEITMGQSPGGETLNDNLIGVPFIQGKADLGDLHPEPSKYTTAPTRISAPGDLLFTVRAPVGYICINNIHLAIGRGIASMKEFDRTNYLYYAILQNQKKFISLEQGTTFTEINKREIKKFKIVAPCSVTERKLIVQEISVVEDFIFDLSAKTV